MRWDIPTIVNGVAIAISLGCLVAALRCDRQYAQASSRAFQAIDAARKNGTDFDPQRDGITSPEIFYQRAKSVREYAIPLWILGLVVAGATRKWIPAVIVTFILLPTVFTGGVRL